MRVYTYVGMCIYVSVCMCVCVCVWGREREIDFNDISTRLKLFYAMKGKGFAYIVTLVLHFY